MATSKAHKRRSRNVSVSILPPFLFNLPTWSIIDYSITRAVLQSIIVAAFSHEFVCIEVGSAHRTKIRDDGIACIDGGIYKLIAVDMIFRFCRIVYQSDLIGAIRIDLL